jgi:hypothetical protein
MRQLLLLSAMAIAMLLPAACTEINPDTRAGIWHPSGINARNLTAMMADPADAVRGRGVTGADSPLAIHAVDRLMAGKPKPLPQSTSQQAVATPSSQLGGSGGP